jgi:hypothetical protein
MRVVKTPAPVLFYAASLPIIVGAVLAGAKQWVPAIVLIIVGVAWWYAAAFWFARRVHKIRREQELTSRDIVEIDYPPWMRWLVKGYVGLLAGTIGLGFIGLVVFVVVALIRK